MEVTQMTIDEIKTAIKNKDLDNITWARINRIMAHPEDYCLTFGEMMYVVDQLTKMAERTKEACTIPTETDKDYQKKVNARVRKDIRDLKSELADIKKRLSKISNAFNGDYDDDEEEEY